jgi:hypothetical protein
VTVREVERDPLNVPDVEEETDALLVSLGVRVDRRVSDTLGVSDMDMQVVVDWDCETEEQGVGVTEIEEVVDKVLVTEKDVDSVTVRDIDTQEDVVKEGEGDEEEEIDGVCWPVIEPSVEGDGEVDSLVLELIDTVLENDPPRNVRDMEGEEVADVLRETLWVPEPHTVTLPLGVRDNEGVTEEDRVPLNEADTVGDPDTLGDPVLVEVKHKEGEDEAVVDRLDV